RTGVEVLLLIAIQRSAKASAGRSAQAGSYARLKPSRDAVSRPTAARRSSMRRLMVSLACSLVVATSAWAQLASQTALVGTVTDQGGLVVPGAQVVAVNVGTKDTYETTTNAEGYYNIQFVRSGAYDISVSLTGFQTSKVSGVAVATNQV